MSSFLAREGVRPREGRSEKKTKRATSFRARRRVSRRDERSWRRLLRRRRRSNRPFRGGRTSRGGERRSGGLPAPFASDADGDESDPRRRRAPARGDFRRDSISSHHWRRGGRSMIGVVSERREKKRQIDRPVARGSSASRSRSAFASRRGRAARSGRPRRVLGRPLGRL